MPNTKMGLVELEPDQEKHSSSKVNVLASGTRGLRFHTHSQQGKVSMFEDVFVRCHESFAAMTLNKCTFLRFRTSTGCPLCRKSNPPVQG